MTEGIADPPTMSDDMGGEMRHTRDWYVVIEQQMQHRPAAIRAETFLRRYNSASQPIEVICDDGNTYVVKALRHDERQGRMLFNDQCAARLGRMIGAPVPQVELVEIGADLIALNPDETLQMGHLVPGLAHGSLRIEDSSERMNNFSFSYEGDNRARYAMLAIFFGWLASDDCQFIFKNSSPRLVFSHDHGNFFPGKGPDWTVADLKRAPKPAAAPRLRIQLELTEEELAKATAPLRALSAAQVAWALAASPDDWEVRLDERAAMADYIWRRRAQMITAYAQTAPAGG